jgi:tripeptidyl-peptidase I
MLAATVFGTVTYFVKHQPHNIAILRSTLEQVSDPQHSNYGQYLSLSEVVDLQRPLEADIAAVRAHIRRAGGIEISTSQATDKIIAKVPLHAVQSELSELWKSVDIVSGLPRSKTSTARIEAEAKVKAHMLKQKRAAHERAAHAAVKTSVKFIKSVKSDNPQSCLADRAVPPCIRKAYGIENEVSKAGNGNSQAVIVNQGYKMSDLNAFCSEYSLKDCPKTVTDVGKNDGEAGDEATLDVQYSTATGQGVPLTWVYINGHSANPFTNWITWASNTSTHLDHGGTLPYVHSLSVGEPEDEFASDNGGVAAVDRMNNEIAAIGSRGVSIIFASGDSGYQKAQKYPSSSPYVTSVGGVFNGELGMDVLQVDDLTTGGFSSLDVNLIGKWQVDAVNAWTKTKGARGYTNTSRRACPDLAIYDSGFYTVQGGSDQPIGGTSAAAPTLAGMISSINGHLLDAGKPTLGFLNPFLYQNAKAFLDITKGGNNGFDATVGYDPASGLGTFSPTTFSTLKAAALAKLKSNNNKVNEMEQEKEKEKEKKEEEAPATSDSNTAPTLLVGLRHSTEARKRLDDLFWAVADPSNAEAEQVDGPSDIAALSLSDPADLVSAKLWLTSIGANMDTLRVMPTGDALEVEWASGKGQTQAPKVPTEFADYVVLKGATDNHLTSDLFKSQRSIQPPQKQTKQTKQPHANNDNNDNDNNVPVFETATQRRRLDSGMGPVGQKKAYNVPAGLKGTNKGNSQMVFGTGTFGYRKEDIDMFFSTYATTSSSKDVSFDASNKWTGKTGKNFVEGELDVSYIAAMAPGVKTLVANTNTSAATESGEGFGAALLAFLVELNGRDTVPNVLSMSLGSLSFGSCDKMCSALSKKGGHSYSSCWAYLQTQFQACMFDSETIEQRIDAEFQKLGLRGVTITAASGDGASHFAFGPFSGGIGSDLDSVICSSMHMPVYPTASPYVLSVGGTQWSSDDIYGPECSASAPCGWTDTGCGFSWQHAAPAYQNATTPAAITEGEKVAPKTMSLKGTYNASGRAYPDVAALAAFGIPLCTYGGCSGSGGTSASAPTVAGMLSLINDARLNSGLKPLGFINTKLYSLMADAATYAECFTDVGIAKLGEEWDCSTYSSCDGCDDGGGAGRGFVATTGWDAQTGFGQPNFAGWMKHFGK